MKDLTGGPALFLKTESVRAGEKKNREEGEVAVAGMLTVEDRRWSRASQAPVGASTGC